MASWGEEVAGEGPCCYSCGEPVELPLVSVGSLRCLDCRVINAPLDPQLAPADEFSLATESVGRGL